MPLRLGSRCIHSRAARRSGYDGGEIAVRRRRWGTIFSSPLQFDISKACITICGGFLGASLCGCCRQLRQKLGRLSTGSVALAKSPPLRVLPQDSLCNALAHTRARSRVLLAAGERLARQQEIQQYIGVERYASRVLRHQCLIAHTLDILIAWRRLTCLEGAIQAAD
ncbi:MAG: hypothetical protein U0Z44_13500 [Kouleothrix sp.]